MKILYLINQITGSGGLQKIVLDKANYMVEKYGFEIHLLCGIKQKAIPNFYVNPKINIHYIHKKESNKLNPNNFVRLFGYVIYIKKIKPDVIFVCNNQIEDFILPLFINKKVRIIKEIHGSYESRIYGYNYLMGGKSNKFSRICKYMYPCLLKKFDKVVVLTHKDKELWGLPNICVIENFTKNIEIPKLHSSIMPKCYAIAIGRLEKNKGFKDLIKSWEKVIERNPTLNLRIFGEGHQRQELENLISQLELNNKVKLMGFSSKITEECTRASIFVSTTFSEGFPLSYVEAQQCGLPIVSYDSPNGPGEIVNHGIDGFLCPIGDISAFANYVLKLADKNLYEQMSNNAIENVKRFDKKIIMNKWFELLT